MCEPPPEQEIDLSKLCKKKCINEKTRMGCANETKTLERDPCDPSQPFFAWLMAKIGLGPSRQVKIYDKPELPKKLMKKIPDPECPQPINQCRLCCQTDPAFRTGSQCKLKGVGRSAGECKMPSLLFCKDKDTDKGGNSNCKESKCKKNPGKASGCSCNK